MLRSVAMTDAPDSLRIIREKETEQLTGISAAQRLKLEGQGLFPRRVPLGLRSVGWIKGEVDAWIKGRMAIRDDVAALAEAYEMRLPPAVRHRLRRQRESSELIEADAPT